jgi:branched-chain amino acid aminotransferase
MINFNGKIIPKNELNLSYQNRAFKYGDSVFDTLKYENDKIYFIEDHYFRLMSSMRMLRMNIPMNFTLKYYKNEILNLVKSNYSNKIYQIRVTVFRRGEDSYNPVNNDINFVIEAKHIVITSTHNYEVELYKDFFIFSGLLSTIKTNNRLLNVLASIYASENDYQNCILINEKKSVVEFINANIFLISKDEVLTPPLSEGCVNGIIRKKIINLLTENKIFKIRETPISPFELLKVDEVFLTNSITEIQSVNKYKKKVYDTQKTEEIKRLFKTKFN